MMNKNNNNNQKRYKTFNEYLKKKFGTKVYKITLDAGFSCPNRDGTISTEGCIFCDDCGSFSQSQAGFRYIDIPTQIDMGIEYLVERFRAEKFMSYFQSFSNTYKPVQELESLYTQALNHKDIVGISIGTRPDCVDDEKLDLIAGFNKDYETWIEYGLQSIHDKTLKKINRGHDYDCFLRAYEKTKEKGIKVCVHVILGLWETKEEMLQTALELAKLRIDGIKLHMICALKGTKFTQMYENGEIELLEEDEYINLLCDILEVLPPETITHRLAGSGLRSIQVAPNWINKKFECLNKLDREFERRNSWQGSRFRV